MEKSRTLQTNINESRLHARQNPGYTAFVDVANKSGAGNALNKQFLQHPVVQDGGPHFTRRHIYKYFFLHEKP
jgi:hypothetical protein